MSHVNKHKSKYSSLRSDLLIYVKMSTLLGFTWILGFVAALADVKALWYIFWYIDSLQGVYIFIAFICNKRVFKLWRNTCTCIQKVSATTSSRSKTASSDRVKMKGSKGEIAEGESML